MCLKCRATCEVALANFANVTSFYSRKKQISSKFRFARIFEATHSSVRQVPSCFSFTVETEADSLPPPPSRWGRVPGFFFVSHFRLPLLLPSAPTDLSGPNLKTSNWTNLALPVLKRTYSPLYCKFIHARNTFKLIMMYRFLLPEINILCLGGGHPVRGV
jgi:hypothetical protein